VCRTPTPSAYRFEASITPTDGHRKEAEEMRERLIAVSDIPETGTVSADLLGREVLVTMLNGKPRAFLNVCMHHGGPLVLGGDRFRCEWHGSEFDARTGKALSGPVRPDARLIMLPTHVEDGNLVYVYEDKMNEAPTVVPPATGVAAAEASS
jgi:nitrite reductase/ring-hydroxylating ferredoxin subunit